MTRAFAFISYVRENSEIVDRLAEDLRALGIEVWLDRDKIMPGQRWKNAINQAIQQGAFFIACYSKELNERRETHMHDELRVAIDRLRKMPENRVWFIPLFLNQTKIPFHNISDRETLDCLHTISLYADWNAGLSMILRAMKLEDPNHRRALHLIELIRDHQPERAHAIMQLARIADVVHLATPVLTDALRDEDKSVRQRAAEALGKLRPVAPETVPALTTALLRDPHKDVRERAAKALGELGLAANEAVPALAEALRDRFQNVRGRAAEALGAIGPAAAEAVPALTEALRDRGWNVRVFAAEALGAIGPAAADAVRALINVLGYPFLMQPVADALGAIGPAAAEAVPALIEALRNAPDPWMDPFPSFLLRLWTRALDADETVAGHVALALSKIGPVSVPALIEALRDDSERIRGYAAKILGAIGPAAVKAIPALTTVLGDADKDVRILSANALQEIRPAATELLHAYKDAKT